MSTITLIVFVALGLNMVFVLFLIWSAQEGYEDENGFHLGSDYSSHETQTNDDSMVEENNIFSPKSATQ